MASDIAAKLRLKQYEDTVTEYLGSRGQIVCFTDDNQFSTLLRTTLSKQLGQNSDTIISSYDTDQFLRIVREVIGRCAMPLIFLERLIQGRDMSLTVRQLKSAYPALRIIILTSETSRERLALLHEVGADNFIAKPVSINALIEKMAFTLKPQGKLGQLIDLARQMLHQGQPEQTLKVCKQILELKPNSAAAFLVIGDAFRALGKLKRAQDAYEEASRNADMYLEPLRKLAEVHGELGDTTKQLHYLERMDALSPLNVERKVDMGEIQLEMGNETAAGKLFDSAMSLAGKNAADYIGDVASRVAVIYADKSPEQSEKFLRLALDAKGKNLSRDDIKTFNRLGIVLRQQGKWREALVEYQKAVNIAPDDENIYYNMGMASAEGRDFPAARVHMEKALSLNTEILHKGAHMAANMGLVFYHAGNKERAIACIKSALEQDPQQRTAKKLWKQITIGMH